MSLMHQLTDGVSKQIAAKLSELQGDRTDAEMGAVLGVTRTQWSYLRSGRRAPSYALVKRAAIIFPALYPIVMRDLAGEPEAVA